MYMIWPLVKEQSLGTRERHLLLECLALVDLRAAFWARLVCHKDQAPVSRYIIACHDRAEEEEEIHYVRTASKGL